MRSENTLDGSVDIEFESSQWKNRISEMWSAVMLLISLKKGNKSIWRRLRPVNKLDGMDLIELPEKASDER